MTVKFGTFGYTALETGGGSMPPGASGDIVTFDIRTLVDSYRFAALGSGDVLYIAMEGEVFKVTTGGAGVLTWTAIRGQFNTHTPEHQNGAGIRESVGGPTYQSFIQNPMSAVGDILYQAALAAPTAPTLTTVATGGTVAAGTYGVKVTYVDGNGQETTPSSSTSITTTGATSVITIDSPIANGGAAGWNCYITQNGGSTYTKQNATPLLLGAPSALAGPPTSGGTAPPSTNTATSGTARLGAGASGQVLTIASGLPSWIAGSSIGFQNPMTTAQDLIVGGAAGAAGRLGVGSNGQVLSVTGGVVGWSTPAASFGNPMTAAGDVIIGGAAGAATRLAKGADNQVLTIDPTTHLPVWSNTGTTTTLQAESGGAPLTGAVQLHGTGPLAISESGQVITIASSAMTNPMTTPQDLIVGGAAGAAGRLGVGGNGQVLGVTSGVVGWINSSTVGFQSPMTATGDLIYGGTAGAATRLAIGSNGQVLTVFQTGLPVSTPAAPSTFDAAGGTMVSGTVGCKVTYVNALGFETDASATTFQSGGTNHALGVNSPAASANATGWYLYRTVVNGSIYYREQALGSPLAIGTGFFTNNDSSASGSLAPTTNSTGTILPTWQTNAALLNPMVAAGDLILGGSAGAAGRLAKGADSTILTIDPTTHLPVWAAPTGFTNPMSASGDIMYGGTAGAATRLAKSADGDVLTLVSGLPAWAAATGGSGLGASVNTVQLDYNVPAGSDFATGATIADGSTSLTWTDIANMGSFTVDDVNSTIDVLLDLAALAIAATIPLTLRLLIDGATGKPIGGMNVAQSTGGGVQGGAVNIGSLSAGSHTIKLQGLAYTASVALYIRNNSRPNTEWLHCQVIERKVVATGAGGTLDQVRVKSTAGTSLTTGVETPIAWDTNDAAFTTNAAMHSTSSNTTRLVAQTPGNYRFAGTIAFPTNATGRRGASLKVNGTTVEWGPVLPNAGGTVSTYVNFDFEYHLAASDYAEICGYQESGGSLTSFAADSWASMTRLDGYAINPATTLNDMIRATTGGAPERVASTGVQGSIWSTDATGKPGWNGLGQYRTILVSDTSLPSATATVLISQTLTQGTWLLDASIQAHSTDGPYYYIDFWDGTTSYGGAQLDGGASPETNLRVHDEIVVGSGGATIQVRVSPDQGTTGLAKATRSALAGIVPRTVATFTQIA